MTSTIAPANPLAPDGAWLEYAGGYSDMLAQRKGAAAEARAQEKREKQAAQDEKGSNDRTAKSRGKLSFKQKFALENLPKEMEKLEAEIARLEEKMADPTFFQRDPEGFNTAAGKLEGLRADLAAKEEEWLELEVLREELEG